MEYEGSDAGIHPSSKHMNGRTDVFCKKKPENVHQDAA